MRRFRAEKKFPKQNFAKAFFHNFIDSARRKIKGTITIQYISSTLILKTQEKAANVILMF